MKVLAGDAAAMLIRWTLHIRIVALVGLLTACASMPRNYTLYPVPSSDLSVHFSHGAQLMASKGKDFSLVAGLANHNAGSEFSLLVTVRNNAKVAKHVLPTDFQCFLYSEGRYYELPVLPADTAMARFQKRADSRLFWYGLGQHLAASGAGVTTVQTRTKTRSVAVGVADSVGVAYGVNSRGTRAAAVGASRTAVAIAGSGESTSRHTIVNPAMQFLAHSVAASNVASFRASIGNRLQNIRQNMFKAHTLRPGETVAGVVYVSDQNYLVDPSKDDRLIFALSVNPNETHVFEFSR